MRLAGRIARVDWVNPHVWIYVDVTDPGGTVTTWAIECAPPGSLTRRGWQQAMLPAGAEIVVEGYAARDGGPTADGRAITLADGVRRVLEVTIPAGAPAGAPAGPSRGP